MLRHAVRSFVVVLPGLSLESEGCGREFLTAAYNGDSHEALELVDPDLKQVGGMKLMAGLGEAVARATSHGGLKSVESTGSKIDGDRATATAKETYDDGTTVTEADKLRKVDGK